MIGIRTLLGNQSFFGDTAAEFNGYVRCYRDWNANTIVYAHRSIAPLVKAWRSYYSHRWDFEVWAMYRGWFDLRDGDYYKNGRWRFPWRRIPLDPQIAQLMAHCKATGQRLPPLGA